MTNAVKDNPILALGGVVIAAAGAYIIVKYLNSIYRLNKATNYYTKLASSTSDPGKKAKYAEKAKTYGARLDQAKAKARETKKDYIAKTKTMQSSLAEMKKSNADAKAIAKLEKKVTSRNKVLAKIGAL
jgi:biopolymer transport protein ExbB/TolQ